jgi:hypothetical protein
MKPTAAGFYVLRSRCDDAQRLLRVVSAHITSKGVFRFVAQAINPAGLPRISKEFEWDH